MEKKAIRPFRSLHSGASLHGPTQLVMIYMPPSKTIMVRHKPSVMSNFQERERWSILFGIFCLRTHKYPSNSYDVWRAKCKRHGRPCIMILWLANNELDKNQPFSINEPSWQSFFLISSTIPADASSHLDSQNCLNIIKHFKSTSE